MGWNVNSVKLLEQTKLPAFPLVSYCQNLESFADATISNVLTQWIRNTTHFETVFESKLWWQQKITSQDGQCAIHHDSIRLACFAFGLQEWWKPGQVEYPGFERMLSSSFFTFSRVMVVSVIWSLQILSATGEVAYLLTWRSSINWLIKLQQRCHQGYVQQRGVWVR